MWRLPRSAPHIGGKAVVQATEPTLTTFPRPNPACSGLASLAAEAPVRSPSEASCHPKVIGLDRSNAAHVHPPRRTAEQRAAVRLRGCSPAHTAGLIGLRGGALRCPRTARTSQSHRHLLPPPRPLIVRGALRCGSVGRPPFFASPRFRFRQRRLLSVAQPPSPRLSTGVSTSSTLSVHARSTPVAPGRQLGSVAHPPNTAVHQGAPARGFRSYRTSGCTNVSAFRSHTHRRSNPCMQRTRFARR
jgi:hypothetical protein